MKCLIRRLSFLLLVMPVLSCKTNEQPAMLCRQYPSQHFDERSTEVVDTVVLHASGLPSLGHVRRVFQSDLYPVSSHYSIGKRGTLACHVAEDKRAWHAGASALPDGRDGVNDFSIGIELVNLNNGFDRYTKKQLHTLEGLLRDLCTRYKIKTIASHAAVAVPPGRKDDPRGLDWSVAETACPGATLLIGPT